MTPPSQTEDVRLTDFQRTLDEARAGDPRALETLFSTFYPWVEQVVHRSLSRDLRRRRPWLNMRLSTGDVVQEVFRSVLQDLEAFTGSQPDDLRGYLATVTRNRLIDLVRFHEAARRDGRRSSRNQEEAERASAGRGPMTQAMSSEEVSICREEIARFPEREQRLLRARLEDGLDFPTIVERLGFSSISAARRAFFSAQSQLVIRLRRRDAGPRS